jgi:hypothetical protein
MTEDKCIHYHFKLPNATSEKFTITLNKDSNLMVTPTKESLPQWTQLDYEKCPNCPLSAQEHPHCPPAVNLVELVDTFSKLYSYEQVDVTVKIDERSVSTKTTVETAVRSLMGLIMATSECPHFTFLRPMARFHQPFAKRDETIFRSMSSYLLIMHVLKEKQLRKEVSTEGIEKLYEEVTKVNEAFMERMRVASRADANLNSIVSLNSVAQGLEMNAQSILKELEPIFACCIVSEAGKQSEDLI